jgi:hypothetical protein
VKESNNASDDCKSKSLRRAKCGNMTHRENDKTKENVRNTHTFRFIVERMARGNDNHFVKFPNGV